MKNDAKLREFSWLCCRGGASRPIVAKFITEKEGQFGQRLVAVNLALMASAGHCWKQRCAVRAAVQGCVLTCTDCTLPSPGTLGVEEHTAQLLLISVNEELMGAVRRRG